MNHGSNRDPSKPFDSSHQDYNAAFGTYSGDVDSSVNIISAALRYKF